MKKIVSLIMTLIVITTVVFSFTGSSVSEKINPTLTISADNISYKLSDNLYGLSLSDAGYALNGGLVSELVNNNSFECVENNTAGWNIKDIGYAVATEDKMNDNNANYLHISVNGSGSIENTGYTEIFNNKSFQFNNRKIKIADMGFKENETYLFSGFFKNIDYVGTMSVSLKAEGNTEKYEFNIDGCTQWTKISLEIKSEVTADGTLLIEFNGKGNFDIDSVSLVPKSSYGYGKWKYTSLRADLYNAVKGLSPSFIRFSENAYKDAQGNTYGWKDAIGPLETRKQITTNFSENERFYVNSNAMGFYEYLLLCEDLGANPIPVFNIENSAEQMIEKSEIERILDEETSTTNVDEENVSDETTEVPEYESYVQNILDFIEYATGDETTVWGAKRIADGHKKPFKLNCIAVDDSNLNQQYWNKFTEIYNAVNEKYPKLIVITSSGKELDGEFYNNIWQNIDSTYKNVIVNEYYGAGKLDLYKNLHKYDNYERSGAPVIVDSFVSTADGIGTTITKNNIWSALENTTFLMGLEKNSDLVKMASYKWTLAKRNAQKEKTSLIWFDSQDVLLTADYYSQMIFANNMGTNYISTDFDMADEGIYHSVTVDTKNKVVYVKLVNTTNKPYKFDIQLEGFKKVKNPSVQYMTEKFKSAYNDFDEQLHVAPTETTLEVKENKISYDMGSYSISVVRIPYSKNDGTNLYQLPEMDIVSPYMHPMVEYAMPIVLIALVLITGVVILFVRINRHKAVRKENE
ncbi:MAG: hypothetical protein IKW45_03985 [Clostridia bacterium]|nr:hypothetical protein [Clostridia bacterium]